MVDHGHQAIGRDLAFILAPARRGHRAAPRGRGLLERRATQDIRRAFPPLARPRTGQTTNGPRHASPATGNTSGRRPNLLCSPASSAASARQRSRKSSPSACAASRVIHRPAAAATSLQVAINRIGMQARDVVGGITTADAGKEIGSLAMVNQAIHKGDIRARARRPALGHPPRRLGRLEGEAGVPARRLRPARQPQAAALHPQRQALGICAHGLRAHGPALQPLWHRPSLDAIRHLVHRPRARSSSS